MEVARAHINEDVHLAQQLTVSLRLCAPCMRIRIHVCLQNTTEQIRQFIPAGMADDKGNALLHQYIWSLGHALPGDSSHQITVWADQRRRVKLKVVAQSSHLTD
eukprot:jgi/Botrbrau1/21523/Bobra.174_2s0026.1